MSRPRKEPKPYTLKQRAARRPYQYSSEYAEWRRALVSGGGGGLAQAHTAWMRRWSPARFRSEARP